MAILAGFDVHRAQITFDALDTETGEVLRGRMRGDREAVERVGARSSPASTSRWRWRRARAGCSSMRRWPAAGAVVHLAEPAETSALRGKKRHAKTDRADARWLRTLLAEGRLPEAWIPPAHVREWRTQTRLRKTLIDERTSWLQRIQATLFHHGIVNVPDQLLRANGRAFLRTLALPPAAMQRIEVALAIIDEIDRQLVPLERELAAPGAPPGRLSGPDAPIRRRPGHGHHRALRTRRRDPPVGLAQGGPLQRPGHRRLPLRPPLADRPDHPPRLARRCAGRSTKPPKPPASPPAPTTPTTSRSKPAGSHTPAPR